MRGSGPTRYERLRYLLNRGRCHPLTGSCGWPNKDGLCPVREYRCGRQVDAFCTSAWHRPWKLPR